MAVAILYCGNIPDLNVQSTRFDIVIKKSRLVGNDFKLTGRMRIGGPLLDLNYKPCFDKNKRLILMNVNIYGLT